jgi:hypothetical protein
MGRTATIGGGKKHLYHVSKGFFVTRDPARRGRIDLWVSVRPSSVSRTRMNRITTASFDIIGTAM